MTTALLEISRKAQRRLSTALSKLILYHPFFGTLAMRLRKREDPGCGTMWTDGTYLGYDPMFVATTCDLDEAIGVVAHEVMHNAMGHPWRRGGRRQDKWNIAADKPINEILIEAGFKMLKGCMRCEAHEKGKSAEWIYANMPDPSGGCGPGQPGQQNQGQGQQNQGQGQQGPGTGGGCVRDAGRMSKGAVTEAEWQVATIQAAQAALQAGRLPASLQRLVEEIKNPAVDWKAALRRFIQTTAKNDYSWRRPNRRYLASGLFLPSLYSESMPPMVIGLDTSGSIGQAESAQFVAECAAIMHEMRPQAMYIAACDARLQWTGEFLPGDEVSTKTIECKGGGGTHFHPVFDWVAEQGIEPACVVYLTDGYPSHWPEPPGYPVLWAITTDIEAPFGETLRVRLGE